MECAIRPSANAHAADIDAAASLDRLVERGHQIDVVFAAPVTDDLAPEMLAVSVRSARVEVQDEVAHPDQDLELVHERPSVLSMRTAVNLQDERIRSTGIEVPGLKHPASDHPSTR